MNNHIVTIVEDKLNCTVLDINIIGKGASGSVYKVQLDKSPYYIALKISNYPKLMFDEYKRIKFISEH